ncbi:efflux RND transporter permease subunit [Jannaschia donghaensis]|uniref:Efflux transporter, putative, hydrophobe/amphiphile efflux-3 (HAE3) family n=1 Tax=Jannaschia donghaensis TaxID=420998 RepID=A0A0M6YNG4_9RHOB|nr:MMPL family transporter [Jannaschia donghaensis]CTQ51470.1 efflux transporter, putative, hydrophobe/amphiphile efflux-3 (HAE3) family [Jannaschia donghaensis]
MTRLIFWIVDRPKVAAVILLAALAVLFAPLGTLRFDGDVGRVFLSDSPLSKAQRTFDASSQGAIIDVAILIEADEPLSPADLKAARDLALNLEFADGVAAVSSTFSLRFPPRHAVFPDAPVLPADLADDAPGRLDAFRGLETGLPTLIAERALLFVVAVDTKTSDTRQAIEDLDEIAAPLRDAGLRVTLTGAEAVAVQMRAGLSADLLRLNAIGAVLTALTALLLLRNLRLAVIAVGPGLASGLAVLGLAAWLGQPITVLSNVIPVLMLILGVANGLHLTVHLTAEEGSLSNRIARTLATVGPASVLTALTTALAFGTILGTGNMQLEEFATLGAVGAIITLVILLPGFAILSALLAPAPRALGKGFARTAERIGGPALRMPRRTAAAGGVLLVLAGAGFSTTQAWFPLYQNLPADSALAPAHDRIAGDFGGAFRLWVEMPEEAAWPDLRRAVRAVEAAVKADSVLSELALARWLGTPETPPSDEARARLPTVVTDRLRDPETGRLRFAVALPEPMRSSETLIAFDRIEAAALAGGAAQVLGLPAIMRHESVALIYQLSLGLLAACAGGALLVAGWLRQPRLFPIVLISNLLPVLIVGAALHMIAAGQLTPPAVLALTIAFGIAVDDSIHYLNRYRIARQTEPTRTAVRSAVRSAGGVMIMTSILLCAGLAATGLSLFFPVRLFGAMMVLTLVAALIADLVVLPALLMIGDRHADR